MMFRHALVAQGATPQSLQQQAVEMIAAHTLSCGQTVKTVLHKLQAAPGALQNEEFLLLAKTFREVGLYPFVDDASGRYAATVVDAQPWASLLPNVIEGVDEHSLVGLKIT
jgi:hypothetical protein